MKRLVVFFWIVLAVAGIQGQEIGKKVSILDRFEADKLFREGMDLYNSNKMVQALEKFTNVSRLNPAHPDVYELLGEIFYLEGSYENAYNNFKIASKQHPENAKLHNDLGVAAAGTGTYITAIGHFEEALRLDPNYQDARSNLEEARKRQQALANNSDLIKTDDGEVISSSLPDESKFQNTEAPEVVVTSTPTQGGQGPTNIRKRNPGQSYDYSGSRLDVRGSTDRNIEVVAVKVTASRTIVTFRIRNPERKTFKFKLAPPGSDDAWILVDSKGSKSYSLLGFLNQPQIRRDRPISMGYGQKYLTAYFERLNPDVFEFNILEGKEPVPGAWNFYMVSLSTLEDQ